MIFSKYRNFLFIKGRKVAGTSIEMALTQICGPDDIITPITPADERERIHLLARGAQNYAENRAIEEDYVDRIRRGEDIKKPKGTYHSHMSLSEFTAAHGSPPGCAIVCSERLPYAKVISMANMALRTYRHLGDTMVSNPERLKRRFDRLFETGEFAKCKNIEMYRDTNGRLNVRVIRYEKLRDDFAGLMSDLGVSPAPELPHAKQGMQSNSVPPLEVFSREQIEKINSAFADEFDAFGYERL